MSCPLTVAAVIGYALAVVFVGLILFEVIP